MYDYKKDGAFIPIDNNEFQFKHCTIIRITGQPAFNTAMIISIQALYDYKLAAAAGGLGAITFQFKHCTIISFLSFIHLYTD